MSDASLHHVRDTTPDTAAAFARQVRVYLRSYQRTLKRRPTNLQRSLMQTAAVAQARYDAALRDPTITGQNLGYLERCARR